MSARLLRVRHAVRAPAFWGRFVQFHLGLMTLGLGLAVMLAAGVGLGPWTVFHEGLSLVTGLSFGRTLQLVGLVVLALAWWWTGQRPGLGTFINMLLVGPWVDVFRAGWMPAPQAWLPGMTQFLVGLSLVGMGSGLYITAELGAGPRDGFVLGLARKLRRSVRRTRAFLEFTVLALGYLMGGTVGAGTVAFALLIGPLMQFFLRLFRRPSAQRS